MANSTPLHISPTPRLFLHGCPVLFPVGLENGQHNISTAEHLITLHSEHSSLFFLLQSMALHFSPSPSSAPLYIGLNNLILDWRRQIHKFTLLIWSVRLQQSDLIVQPKFEPTKKKKKTHPQHFPKIRILSSINHIPVQTKTHTLSFSKPHMTFFVPWNTKTDILKNILVELFNVFTVNRDLSLKNCSIFYIQSKLHFFKKICENKCNRFNQFIKKI